MKAIGNPRRPSGVSCPRNRMLPPSSAWTPASALIRVDFPAPFSPSSATISPRSTRRVTSSSARVAPNCFDALRTSSSGGASMLVGIVAVSVSSPQLTPQPPGAGSLFRAVWYGNITRAAAQALCRGHLVHQARLRYHNHHLVMMTRQLLPRRSNTAQGKTSRDQGYLCGSLRPRSIRLRWSNGRSKTFSAPALYSILTLRIRCAKPAGLLVRHASRCRVVRQRRI